MKAIQSATEAEEVARQKGFKTIVLGRSFILLPADKRMSHFGFARYDERQKCADARSGFFARVRADLAEWTAFFAEVRCHLLTKKKAPHQFNDQLATAPPDGGIFSDRVFETHRKRLESLQFDPAQLPTVLSEKQVIERGDVIFHCSDREDAVSYRMKNAALRGNRDNSPFYLDWEMLCELATFWGRQTKILEEFGWGADPLGVVHPNPAKGFVGWRMAVPYDPPTPVETQTPQKYMETKSKEPEGDAATTETAASLQGAPSQCSPEQVLLFAAEHILGNLHVLSDDEKLKLCVQTLRPAAEALAEELRTREVVHEIPEILELVRLSVQQEHAAERLEALTIRESEVNALELKITQQQANLSKKEAELNQLAEMVADEVDSMFATKEAALVKREAAIHAQANELDRLKRELLDKLSEQVSC